MIRRNPRLAAVLLAIAILAPGPIARGGPTGGGSVDEEVETLYRQVTWDDFKGRWSRQRHFDGRQAYIATGIQIPEVEVEPHPLAAGGWAATAPDLRPYAVMSKYDSSYIPGANNDRVLAHEQGHFDLTEVVRRRLAARLVGLEGRGPTAETALDDFRRRFDEKFQEALEELDRLQDRYDGETGNGSRKKAQKKWLERIERMLAEAAD